MPINSNNEELLMKKGEILGYYEVGIEAKRELQTAMAMLLMQGEEEEVQREKEVRVTEVSSSYWTSGC